MSLNLLIKRSISTSCANYGKRNFRKFQLFNKRGTRAYKKALTENPEDHLFHNRGVRPVGYDQEDENGVKHFMLVPEKIPDIIVPDLTDCKFKPYVSYRVPDVIQSEFTAEDLFNVVYSAKIMKDFNEGKLDEEGNPLEPSPNEKLTAEEAKTRARQTGTDIF